jgi:OPT family oligopeptide transporter
MAIQHLTEEQISSWTRAQKDQWWFTNVFRGDMAQLTLRSAMTGFLLGGILAGTALYVGAKSGVGIGVNLTSVILAFAVFNILSKLGLAKDFTILENNCSQSIASAAGYMISPMITSLTAYMVVTGKVLPWWHMMLWMVNVAILGVLIAFLMKRRFINEDQLPFPEGRAAGIVLDTLYTGDASKGMMQARLLGMTAVFTGLYQMIVSDGWMRVIQFKLLRMDKWAGMTEAWNLQERLDTYYYTLAVKYDLWIPKILGTDFRVLGLRLTLDAAMLGVGGLMGIAVASSVILGAFINFVVLAPIMISLGEIAPRVAADGSIVALSRPEIVNQWSLWWGVTIMVVGSIVGLFARPEIFTGLFKRKAKTSQASADPSTDVLRDIEVPLWISYVGVPIFSMTGATVTHYLFDVPWLLALISLPLILVLSVIAVNSMALTSWVPLGALAKITQFTVGAVDRTNPASNLIPAGMTAEIVTNAAVMLSDIKPGYMLGAKPRQQAIGHVIGIFSGALACVPLFYLLFLPADAHGVRSTTTILSENFAFPSVVQWKGVADLIARGFSSLHTSAIISMIVAAIAAVIFEVTRIITKGRFPISSVSVGLGVVLPPEAALAMWLGALVFWWMGRRNAEPGTNGHAFWVEGCEPICAGLISGAALVGIGNALINVLV